MTIVEQIAVSEARPLIDQLLLEQLAYPEIVKKVAEKKEIIFTAEDIERYHKESYKSGDSPLRQVIQVTQDLSNGEPPALDEFSKLSMHFSFKKTNEDLDLIYERIRDLRAGARVNLDDPTYDRRIKEYLSQAEAIRTRVYRHQYEQIRHAVLLTVGKKICMAAISILMPYIHKDYRAEAMRKFQSAVEPMLDIRSVPDIPVDVAAEPIPEKAP